MFEDKIDALNQAREMGTAKKKKTKTAAKEPEKKVTTTSRTYSPPKPSYGNNGMQSVDLNLLIRALRTVMYGEQEDYQDIDPNQVQVYTVAEVKTMLAISRPAVYELLKRDDFPCVKIGTGWKIPKKAFHEWLNNSRYSSEVEDVDESEN